MSASETKLEKLIVVAALTMATVFTGVSSLQCYQCTVTPSVYMNETKKLCTHFDYSERFVVECPYSTMCMKQDINLSIQNGVKIKAMVRDCAAQKHEYQDYVRGHWTPKVEVLEPYEEGCQETDDKGARTSPTRFCYCRGHLCNAAPSTNNDSFHTDAMAVILVFNLLKYIRSLR